MLKVESVSCKIKNTTIVRDITFTVRPGEILALLGANGAGKSTLVRMISGEQKANTGKITLYGKELTDYRPKELAVLKATLSQHNSISMDFLSNEIVMMGRYPHHKNDPTRNDHEIVEECMAVCGIGHLAERPFPTLSGGEQQRVQLARVLAQVWDSPRSLILLDEPVTGLDMLYQQQTMAIVRSLAQKGYMVVAVLHDVNLAAQYADRILMMKNGRRWSDGTPSEVLTPLNIYSGFSVHTEVVINARTLRPYVVPKDIRLNAELFNSRLAATNKDQTLKQKYELLKSAAPSKTLKTISEEMNVSEGKLLMEMLNDGATLLKDDIKTILKNLHSLGDVQCITENTHCVQKKTGSRLNFVITGQYATHEGENIQIRLALPHLSAVLAVHDPEEDIKSLCFINRAGEVVHKYMITENSNEEAYDRFVEKFRAAIQGPVPFHGQEKKPMQTTPESRDNIRISISEFKKMMADCAERKIPLTMSTSNNTCTQICNGTIRDLIGLGNWYNLSGGEFSLQLHEEAIGNIQRINRPLQDQYAVEMFSSEGELMACFHVEDKSVSAFFHNS